jgi:hypothetical protein
MGQGQIYVNKIAIAYILANQNHKLTQTTKQNNNFEFANRLPACCLLEAYTLYGHLSRLLNGLELKSIYQWRIRFRSFVTSCTVNTLKTKPNLAQPKIKKSGAIYLRRFFLCAAVYIYQRGSFFHHRRAENTLLIRPSHICIGKSSGICIYVRWCGARCFWSSAATLWTHNVDTRTAAKETPHQTRSAFISHQLGWLLTCVTGLCLSRAAAAQEEETGLGFLLLFCCFDARRVIIQYIYPTVCVLLNSSSLSVLLLAGFLFLFVLLPAPREPSGNLSRSVCHRAAHCVTFWLFQPQLL